MALTSCEEKESVKIDYREIQNNSSTSGYTGSNYNQTSSSQGYTPKAVSTPELIGTYDSKYGRVNIYRVRIGNEDCFLASKDPI